MRKTIRHKGYEILHRHINFGDVYFQAWQGENKVNNKQIRMDGKEVDWDNPLTEEQKDYLVEEEKKV